MLQCTPNTQRGNKNRERDRTRLGAERENQSTAWASYCCCRTPPKPLTRENRAAAHARTGQNAGQGLHCRTTQATRHERAQDGLGALNAGADGAPGSGASAAHRSTHGAWAPALVALLPSPMCTAPEVEQRRCKRRTEAKRTNRKRAATKIHEIRLKTLVPKICTGIRNEDGKATSRRSLLKLNCNSVNRRNSRKNEFFPKK